MRVIPSKDVPAPGGAFRGHSAKAAEADIIIVVHNDAIGVIKSRRPLIVTHHERDEHGGLVFSLRYYD